MTPVITVISQTLESQALAATTGSSLLFGLSPADAGIFGAMVAGAIMTFLGVRKGEEARKAIPPPDMPYASIGAALIDRGPLQELTIEVRNAVAASKEQTASIWAVVEAVSKFADDSEQRARNATKETLEELGDKVDRLISKQEEQKTGGRAR